MSPKRLPFEAIFMHLATQVAQRSHCLRKTVGAVLVKDTRIISIGYNGPPSGTINCDEDNTCVEKQGCGIDRKGHCLLSIHAEQNAILYAAKQGASMEGATLYCTLAPCLACARIIYTMGITQVYYRESYAQFKGLEKEEGKDFLERFGVEVSQYLLTP